MKYFFTTKVKVILIVALILAIGLGIIGTLVGKTPADTLVQSVLTPLRTGVSSLTAQAEKFYNYMFRYESLEAENELLKEQIAQMQDDNRKVESLNRENERLRNLLKLEIAKEGFDMVDGYIISRNSNDWNSSFTINRGSSSGLEPGMCAVTANKEVVGLVTEVGPRYAVVKTIMDSSLEISAIIASSGYGGMVQGGYSDNQRGLLRMEYLPSSAVIRNNDQVVTAGSTVYPRNLIIGKIVDAGFDDTGVAKYAVLEPSVNIDNLEQVFILTRFATE